jgi:hypothetical protein
MSLLCGRVVVGIALVLGGVHAKRVKSESGEFPDFQAAASAVGKHKAGDMFVVFKSGGDNNLEPFFVGGRSKPSEEEVSLDRFRDTLAKCGSEKAVCIGYYSFLYPLSLTSRTPKQKTVLVKAVDEAAIQEAAGGAMMATKMVVMGAVRVWSSLINSKYNSFSPSVVMELTGASNIQDSLVPEKMWEEIKKVTTRVGPEEQASFVKHAEELNSGAVSVGEAIIDDEIDDGSDQSEDELCKEWGICPDDSDGTVRPTTSTEEIVKQVQAAMEKKLESMVERIVNDKMQGDTLTTSQVKKIAQEEIGNALRNLGGETQKVSKNYLEKSRM